MQGIQTGRGEEPFSRASKSNQMLTRQQEGTNIADVASERYFNLWTIIAWIILNFKKYKMY